MTGCAVPEFKTDRLSALHWGPPETGPARASLERDLARILTPPVLEGLPPSFDPDPEGISAWISQRAAEADILMLRHRDDESALGFLILASGENEARSLHLGYVIGLDYWGRGYAGEAVTGLVQALRPIGPIALRAGVAPSNTASIRVLEKAGFRPLTGEMTQAGALQYSLAVPGTTPGG